MATVGIYEAKTHLSKLIERVEAGETIQITKNGKVVAQLNAPAENKVSQAEIFAELRKIRSQVDMRGLTIKELIEEGRKY